MVKQKPKKTNNFLFNFSEFLNSKEIVYSAAALGIVMDVQSRAQRFLGGGELSDLSAHSDEILSLSVSKLKNRIATAEISSNPQICIWDTTKLGLICKFRVGDKNK